jgi:hypothetical protein
MPLLRRYCLAKEAPGGLEEEDLDFSTEDATPRNSLDHIRDIEKADPWIEIVGAMAEMARADQRALRSAGKRKLV